MSVPDLERVKTVFADALERTGADRRAYLDAACGGDAALRAEVDAFLAASEGTGALLGAVDVGPAHDATPAQVGDPSGVITHQPPPTPGADGPAETVASPIREAPGARIGRYKLLQQIGEGGFGVVFMAEQERPVRRRVALKVIKLGMDTKQVVARFEAERQALALMDHPNIAKVFGGGSTDAGRPYFVMELVRGVPITEYCDANRLAARDRLDLFVQVCQAVQHAHQKGVIHRDLKPNNVLVTLQDGRPVPKVIDFGIAKATDQRLTERTLFTEFRQMIGTPQYMSPEQAEATGADVDTRADIYSLGVLLYELLVGTTPFDARELRSKAYGEIQRMIREVEPPRPSTRLSTMGGERLATVAAQRQIEPGRLGGLLRGELDWVVMRCLEKDRTRRYETASGLALDVQRYLADEPVQARPATAGYRLRKFVRRNKLAAVAVGAVAAALLLGTVGTTVGMLRARSARGRAESAEAAAVLGRNDAVLARDDMKRATTQAVAARGEAEQARQDAEQRSVDLRRALHASNVGAVQAAARAKDYPRARTLLAQGPPEERGWEWSYLNWSLHGESERQTYTLPGGVPNYVGSAVFSRDGRRIVVGNTDGSVVSWARVAGPAGGGGELATRPVCTFQAYPPGTGEVDTYTFGRLQRPAVWLAGVSDDGRRVVTMGGPGLPIKVWDADTGRQTATLDALEAEAWGQRLSLSADGKRAALAFPNERGQWARPRVWDLEMGNVLLTAEAPNDGGAQTLSPRAVMLTPDGRRLVGQMTAQPAAPATNPTGAQGPFPPPVFLTVWDVASGRVLQTIDSRSQTISPVPEGSGLFAPLPAGIPGAAVPPAADDAGRPLAVSADGRTLATAAGPDQYRVWDLGAGREIGRWKVDAEYGGTPSDYAALSDDGRLLAAVHGGRLLVWDVRGGGRLVRSLPCDELQHIWFAPDARTVHGTTVQYGSSPPSVAAGLTKAFVVSYDVWSEDAFTIHPRTETAVPLRFTGPGGGQLVVLGKDSFRAELMWFDARTGELLRTLPIGTLVQEVAFDGRWVAASTEEGFYDVNNRSALVHVYDTEIGRRVATVPRMPGSIGGLALSPDAGGGGRLAVSRFWWDFRSEAGGFGAIHLMAPLAPTSQPGGATAAAAGPAAAGSFVRGYHAPGRALACDFSPDGRRLVVQTSAGRWHLFETATGRQIPLPKVRNLVESRTVFSADSSRMALPSGSTVVVDTATGREVMRLPAVGHNGTTFSPDGTRLITSGQGGMRVWDLRSGGELLSAAVGGDFPVFSPDGKALAAAVSLGTRTKESPGGTGIVIWDGARPSGDVLAARRAARAQQLAAVWVGQLHEEGLFDADLRRRIEEERSPEVSADIRAAALERVAEVRPGDAISFYMKAKQRCLFEDPSRSPEDAKTQLAWAQYAARLEPANGRVLLALGVVLYANGKYKEALPVLRHADEINARQVHPVAGPYPGDAAFIAMTLHRLGRADEARRELARAAALALQRPWNGSGESELVRRAEQQMGGFPALQLDNAVGGNDKTAAAAALRGAADARRKLYGEGHPAVIDTLVTLAAVSEQSGDFDGTEAALRRAYEGTLSDGDGDQRGARRRALVDWLVRQHRAPDAETLLRKALAGDDTPARPTSGPSTRPRTRPATDLAAAAAAERADVLAELADLVRKGGDPADAERLLRQALDVRRPAAGAAADASAADLTSRLARLLAEQGRRDEAEALLLAVLRPGQSSAALPAEAEERLAQQLSNLYAEWQADRAVGWRPWLVAARQRSWREQIDRHTRDAAERPDDPFPVYLRALVEAKSGRFAEAAADFRRAIDLKPDDHMDWYHLGCLLAYAGEADAHRTLCRDAFARFERDEGAEVGERLAKACLLVAGAAEDPSVPMKLMDRAVASAASDPARAGVLPWFQMGKGIAEYRAGDGHYAAAVEWLDKAAPGLAYHGHATAALGYYRALALRGLSRAADARGAFDAAEGLWARLGNAAGEDDVAIGGLENWLVCQVARREAQAAFGLTKGTGR